MLTSQLGVRLILLMGQTVPLPASPDVLQAISKVEVTNDVDACDGFQITLTVSKDKPPDYNLLQGGTFDPFARVIIGVILGVTPQVLIDGVITHQQLTPSEQPGKSILTVSGRDVTAMMDLEEKDAQFQNMPDFLIFTQIIATYAQYGMVPTPTPTTDIPIMLQRIPRQHETDLAFINRMAERNGYVFYVEPVTIGVNTAYFGPENRLGLPQSALSMNMGDSSNLKSIDFSLDALNPIQTKGSMLEPITKTVIPIPSLPSLRLPPLVLNPVSAKRTVRLRETASQSPTLAPITAIAAVTRAPEAVKAEGEIDVVRYGSVLQARKLVGVRGVGFSYDGFYYVRRVNHTINPVGQYTQKFVLSREGTMPLLPLVAP